MRQYPLDVLCATGVLDVEEDDTTTERHLVMALDVRAVSLFTLRARSLRASGVLSLRQRDARTFA